MSNKTLLALTAKLTADTSKFKQGLDKGKKELSGFQKSVGKIGGLIVGAFAISALKSFAAESMRTYDIQAKAEAALLTALDGRKSVQQDIIKQAQDLQKKTLFGDEKSIEAASRLAQVLGNNKKAIQDLLPLVADFATAKKMDMAQAAELIAKSVGSSTNALSRYGVSIEGAVGSSERLQSAVSSLNDMVGGQAEAAANVGTGSITQLSNLWGDFKEEIGELTTTLVNEFIPALKSMVTDGIKEISSLNKVIGEDSIPTWKKLLGVFLEAQGVNTKALSQLSDEINKNKAATDNLNDSAEDQKKITVEQITTLADLKNKLSEVNKEIEGANTADEQSIAILNDKAKALQDQIKYLKELNAEDLKRTKSPTALTPIKTSGIDFNKIDTEQMAFSAQLDLWDRQIDEFSSNIDIVEDKTLSLSETVQSAFGNMVTSFAENLGHMLTGVGSFGDAISGIEIMFGDFLVSMGEAITAYGVSMLAFNEALSNPTGAILAGAALVLAGTVVKDLASSGPAEMADGGIVPPGYPNDTYPALLSSGEVVTPPDKLPESNGNQVIILETKIKGDDLHLVMSKNQKRRNRIT